MNNYPSDEEVSNQYNGVIVNPFSKLPEITYFPKGTTATTYRDHLFYKLLNGWNEERKKAGFKPLTAKRLATAINSNPWLKNSTEELYNILTKCEKAGNYKFASFILFPKKKK